jgi:hypothetical protein
VALDHARIAEGPGAPPRWCRVSTRADEHVYARSEGARSRWWRTSATSTRTSVRSDAPDRRTLHGTVHGPQPRHRRWATTLPAVPWRATPGQGRPYRLPPIRHVGMPSTAKQPATGSALPSVARHPHLDLFDTSAARKYRNRIGSLHLRYRSRSSAALLLQCSQRRLCPGNHQHGILRLDEVSAIGVVICLPPGCGSAGFGHSSEPADTVSGATADEQGEEPDGSVQWRVPDPSR